MKRRKIVKAKTKQSVKRHRSKQTKIKSINKNLDQTDQPYRPGTLYETLFTEANKDYVLKDELIRKVAEMTGKSEKVVNFAYQVLKSPSHRSNKNRSAILEENGKVKLIPAPYASQSKGGHDSCAINRWAVKSIVKSSATRDQKVKGIGLSLGIKHVTPHGLRSFFVTACREAGLPDTEVAALIGDKSGASIIATTYGDILPEHLHNQARRVRLLLRPPLQAAQSSTSRVA